MNAARSKQGNLRIIGGQWRGRRISIVDHPGLRPTPDRVRETLFNWLAPQIVGANCLDLFAGSGALGFEALSRGAARVTLVEKNRKIAQSLVEQAAVFGTKDAEIVCTDGLRFLHTASEIFDLVFLDPPFGENLPEKACETLLNRGNLHPGSLVYVESDTETTIVEPFRTVKKARAGKVQYMLLGNAPGGNKQQ